MSKVRRLSTKGDKQRVKKQVFPDCCAVLELEMMGETLRL